VMVIVEEPSVDVGVAKSGLDCVEVHGLIVDASC
jgi:hypothetical protein